MNQILTINEIESRFPEKWILIQDPETTTDLRIKAGKVLWHSKSKDDVYHKAQSFPSAIYTAVIYTGKIPEGNIFVL